jgi:peptide-methionine (S)-S-oxide reductase
MSGRKGDAIMATELATFGGGCFWCLEPVFKALRGVQGSVSGYAGGAAPNPTYEQVCSGRTGHAEVIQLTFDPAQISYADILGVFFTMHDPTTLNRQGADTGTQYRSIILTHSDEQARIAREVKAEIEAQGLWADPVVTEIVPLEIFYPAEAYHQDYYAKNPYNGYCRAVINPKLAKLRKVYAERLKAPEAA